MNETDIFKIAQHNSGMTIHLSSTFDNIDRTADAVKNHLENSGIKGKKELFATGIVLREGLTNAVRHGHQNNPAKIVVLTITIEEHRLTMEIEDSGNGFNWKKQEKKTACIQDDHGRGISIIKQYFTSYHYNKTGNRLTMTKDL